MKKVITIAGSNSHKSINKALIAYASNLIEDVEIITIDWLSRLNMKIWKEKPMLLMATSPGGRGGATVLQSASAYFPFLGAKIIETYSLPSFYDNFKEGEIIKENFRKELEDKIVGFSKEI